MGQSHKCRPNACQVALLNFTCAFQPYNLKVLYLREVFDAVHHFGSEMVLDFSHGPSIRLSDDKLHTLVQAHIERLKHHEHLSGVAARTKHNHQSLIRQTLRPLRFNHCGL
jgi:hypothetical protein